MSRFFSAEGEKLDSKLGFLGLFQPKCRANVTGFRRASLSKLGGTIPKIRKARANEATKYTRGWPFGLWQKHVTFYPPPSGSPLRFNSDVGLQLE
jgi:hypothetical protein